MRETERAAPSTIRRRLAALSSLYKHLVRHGHAVRNPVGEVERPAINRDEGSTLAFSKVQARKVLDAPPEDTIAGLRDRAILSVGLQVGLRRAEIAALKVGDLHQNRGYDSLRVARKGGRRDALAQSPDRCTHPRLSRDDRARCRHRRAPIPAAEAQWQAPGRASPHGSGRDRSRGAQIRWRARARPRLLCALDARHIHHNGARKRRPARGRAKGRWAPRSGHDQALRSPRVQPGEGGELLCDLLREIRASAKGERMDIQAIRGRTLTFLAEWVSSSIKLLFEPSDFIPARTKTPPKGAALTSTTRKHIGFAATSVFVAILIFQLVAGRSTETPWNSAKESLAFSLLVVVTWVIWSAILAVILKLFGGSQPAFINVIYSIRVLATFYIISVVIATVTFLSLGNQWIVFALAEVIVGFGLYAIYCPIIFGGANELRGFRFVSMTALVIGVSAARALVGFGAMSWNPGMMPLAPPPSPPRPEPPPNHAAYEEYSTDEGTLTIWLFPPDRSGRGIATLDRSNDHLWEIKGHFQCEADCIFRPIGSYDRRVYVFYKGVEYQISDRLSVALSCLSHNACEFAGRLDLSTEALPTGRPEKLIIEFGP
jgi:hypothetical protein